MTDTIQLILGIQLVGASVFLFIASGILILIGAYERYKELVK